MRELFCWFSGGACATALLLSGVDLLTIPQPSVTDTIEYRTLLVRNHVLEGECDRLVRDNLSQAVELDRLRRAAVRESFPAAPAPPLSPPDRIPAPAVPFPTR